MGILDGKNILVTGVLTDSSIAFHVAKLAQEQGANLVLSSFGRAAGITKRVAGRLPYEVPIVQLDVTNQDDLNNLAAAVGEHVPHLDGVLHSIAFAPEAALGGNFLNTEWDDVKVALEISAFSLKSLAVAARPLMKEKGGQILGLDFDATVTWPYYDWMGVSKAALESTCRYLARELGGDQIRVNLVAAGPIYTTAAKGIPGFDEFGPMWQRRAPLGWDTEDPVPTAKACIGLFSDWFPATTGEVLHVDGGVHSQGGP
jgi:meromycolic acid enoyl-[acyl-carrier-protein] reductase